MPSRYAGTHESPRLEPISRLHARMMEVCYIVGVPVV